VQRMPAARPGRACAAQQGCTLHRSAAVARKGGRRAVLAAVGERGPPAMGDLRDRLRQAVAGFSQVAGSVCQGALVQARNLTR
jgi:hypothetical protein